MARARRTSEQIAPVAPSAETGMTWDLSDTQPIEVPHSEKKTRKKGPSRPAVTSETEEQASGEIVLSDVDLKEMAVEEVANDNETNAEMTITPAEEMAAPRRKRARRVEISADELAKRVSDEAVAKAAAKEKRVAEMAARVDAAMKTEAEEAWFKQGEDTSHIAALAEKQQAEDSQKEADVRRHIAESYDDKKTETIIDTDEEIEAAAKQAEAMIASGELNRELFNANDYRYLLIEKVNTDRKLETAGWWQARKLRAELREYQRQIADYEQQIMSVHGERYQERDDARKPPVKAWSAARPLPPGSGTTLNRELKPGSGTTVHKPGFFARLFGRK